MDSYIKTEAWDSGFHAFNPSTFQSDAPIAFASGPSPLSAFEGERVFVVDDPMVMSENHLRARSLLYTAPIDTAPYPPYYNQEDHFLALAADVTPATFNQMDDFENQFSMDVDYSSATSSPANSPRELMSLPQVKFEHGQPDLDLTPREDEPLPASIRMAVDRVKKRTKGHGLYRCPLNTCQRTYRRKGDLKVHCKKKHPDQHNLPDLISKPRSTRAGKAFLCPEPGCPCGFMRQRGLIRHYRKKHPERAADPLSLLYIGGDADCIYSNDQSDEQPARPTRMSSRMRSIRNALGHSFSSGSFSDEDSERYGDDERQSGDEDGLYDESD